jgi:hypothetical protein
MSFEKNPKDKYPLKSEFDALEVSVDSKIGPEGGEINESLSISKNLDVDSLLIVTKTEEIAYITHQQNYNNPEGYNGFYTKDGKSITKTRSAANFQIQVPRQFIYSGGLYFTYEYQNGVYYVSNSLQPFATWVKKDVPENGLIMHLAAGGGKIVMVTTKGTYLSEDNSDTWTKTSNYANSMNLYYVNGYFVTPSTTGSIYDWLSSKDGKTWTQFNVQWPSTTPSYYTPWYDITYSNGKYLMIFHATSDFAISDDLKTWDVYSRPSMFAYDNPSYMVGFKGKWIIVSGYSGNILTTSDLVTWTLTNLDMQENTYTSTAKRMRVINDRAIYVNNTAMISTADGVSWEKFPFNENISPWGPVTIDKAYMIAGTQSVNGIIEGYSGNLKEELSAIASSINKTTISTLDPVEENITGSDGEIWITYTP